MTRGSTRWCQFYPGSSLMLSSTSERAPTLVTREWREGREQRRVGFRLTISATYTKSTRAGFSPPRVAITASCPSINCLFRQTLLCIPTSEVVCSICRVIICTRAYKRYVYIYSTSMQKSGLIFSLVLNFPGTGFGSWLWTQHWFQQRHWSKEAVSHINTCATLIFLVHNNLLLCLKMVDLICNLLVTCHQTLVKFCCHVLHHICHEYHQLKFSMEG